VFIRKYLALSVVPGGSLTSNWCRRRESFGILGSVGREPIYAAYRRTSLKLMDTRVLDSTLILLEYRLTAP